VFVSAVVKKNPKEKFLLWKSDRTALRKTPAYRKKIVRSSKGNIACAVTKIAGTEPILGRWNTKDSKRKIHRLLSDCQNESTAGRVVTVPEIAIDCTRFATGHYCKDGNQTGEFSAVQVAMRLSIENSVSLQV
jgi:hypothetical protein